MLMSGPASTAKALPRRSLLDADQRSRAIVDGLESIEPEYVLYLPSSTLKHVIDACLTRQGWQTFPIPREEEGVGILSGLVLAGARAVMIVQDNGIGNMLTALTTFPQAYHLPQLIIISRRGGLGEYNSMIHTFCEHVEPILDAADIRYFNLDGRVPIEQWSSAVTRAYQYAHTTHRPILLLCDLMGG
jgi:sulfopyruvate decarboxylase alpha subunit